ncbi:probable cytochrome P450 304a1 [Aricia agestis]|uniref:probable cytochrome P450 304a1 n=1 Tax=Aricia agestis TaxID=91739 RepID=UPI001C209176|nr:probable cytochrome P450 304a1 [Aricia agestis]
MIGVTIALSLCVYFLKSYYDSINKRPDNFPPGPISWPLYGAYFTLFFKKLDDLSGALRKFASEYRTKILGFYLGPFISVVVEDPELIKEVLNREEFDGRVDTILARLRSFWKKLGIFFTDGYFWHVQRRFSLRYLRDYGFGRRDESLETVISREVSEMIDMVVSGPQNDAEKELVKGDLIYLQHYFDAPFVNGLFHIFARFTFPRSAYHLIWKLAKKVLMFQRNSNDFGGALVLTPWLKDVMPKISGYAYLKEGNDALLDLFKKLIDENLADHDESYDRHFLDVYLRKMKEERRTNERTTFTEEQLQLICTDYMFPTASAGQATLTFLIERMLLQPEIQDKIHEELDRVVGRDRLPNLDDRQRLPYTEACLREIMRYETLVPLGILHRAMVDTKLGGYDIPENTVVAVNLTSLHHNKELWGDPENFRPERFLEDGKLCVRKDKSLPFGAGHRLCAGETYARQTMFQVFSGFMQAFEVSTADGKPLKKPFRRIQGIITTVPEFWVRVTPRS